MSMSQCWWCWWLMCCRGYGSQAAGRLVSVTALPSDSASQAILSQWRLAGLPRADVAWRTAPRALVPLGSEGAAVPGGAEGAGLVLPADPAEWLVLGIESSCDDTAVALVRGDGTILAHEIASQVGNGGDEGGLGCMPLLCGA